MFLSSAILKMVVVDCDWSSNFGIYGYSNSQNDGYWGGNREEAYARNFNFVPCGRHCIRSLLFMSLLLFTDFLKNGGIQVQMHLLNAN